MSRIRSSRTTPELAVRRVLKSLGVRYSANQKGLKGTPDIALRKERLAIFVHGCFWHRHRCRFGKATPATRPEFWRKKFEGNVERDRAALATLKKLGWRTLVIWECHSRKLRQVENKLTAALTASSRPPR